MSDRRDHASDRSPTPPEPHERAACIRALFAAALERSPSARTAYLDRACAHDAVLRGEVDALLRAYDHVEEAFLGLDGPDGASLAGRRVGAFDVHEPLGWGGMGVVYRAVDRRLGRPVALKVLTPDRRGDPDASRTLLAEARAASALDHPNICTIYEVGETEPPGPGGGRVYMAMAYYEGRTLQQRIAEGPLPLDEAVAVAVQIADGLEAAHRQGVVHRDVKPANVMLTPAGVVKILDFGLAKVASDAVTSAVRGERGVGTPAYMSPEQVCGERVDARTDVWSLGVVLYEMLTGRRPFGGEHGETALYAIVHRAPEPVRSLRPDVSPALARIVATALAKDPADRPASAAALREALRAERSVSGVLEEAAMPEDAAAAADSWRRRLVRALVRAVDGPVAALLLALAAAALLALGIYRAGPERDGRLRAIAVLPLDNLSGEIENEYFADGMTESLIANLSRIGSLHVISRTSAMRYKRTAKSLPVIARELGVDAVVEGSVLPDGDRVRIQVALVEAASDRTLWTQSFDEPLRDVLALQRAVALEIAREISTHVTPQERARLDAAHAVDPEAYRLYLKGRYFRNREGQPASCRNAIESFEKSIARDATFAPAYAGLAAAYTLAATGHGDCTPRDADVQGDAYLDRKARWAAEQALRLDPELSEAYVSLGLIHQILDLDWPGAEEAFREALALDPTNAQAHYEYGWLLIRTARLDAALEEMHRAVDLDPLSSTMLHGLFNAYYHARRYEEAIAVGEKALVLDPHNGMIVEELAETHHALGRFDEAGALLQRATAVYGRDPAAPDHRLYLLLMTGAYDAARRLFEEHRGGLPLSWSVHEYHAHLEHVDETLVGLEAAGRESRYRHALLTIGVDPRLDFVRGHPRFARLLARLGLSQPSSPPGREANATS